MSHMLPALNELPVFSSMTADQLEVEFNQAIKDNRDGLAALLSNLQTPTWQNLVEPLTARGDQLSKIWSSLSHLNAVAQSASVRAAYQRCVQSLSQWNSELGQNQALYQAYQRLACSAEFAGLSQAQRQAIKLALRGFRRAGVSLPGASKVHLAQLNQRLAKLNNQFSNNVLDATQAWCKHIDDATELAGLPDSALAEAAQMARAQGKNGFMLSLNQSSFTAVISYADKRSLREEIYHAYTTRASDQGPQAGQWDNTPVITEQLKLRHEVANILGFEHFADYSLEPRMADSVEQVETFLLALLAKVKPQAQQEFNTLSEFARDEFGLQELQAWDIAYVSEKLKQRCYALDEETLRPWFPLPSVLSGLFALASQLFGISIEQDPQADTWHPDVCFYHLYRNDECFAGFYTDLFAREHKRSGAWMDPYRVRCKTEQGMQQPLAHIVCNFRPAEVNKPALLSHAEVLTLFHEFGHALQQLLTQMDVAEVSGINGVPWDAVELPSQFMENFCWQKPVLVLISSHYQSGETLPESLLNELLACKNFQSGISMLRHLEYALFDWLLHAEYTAEKPCNVQALLNDIRQQTALLEVPAYNRFQHSFSHIFSGGYAAGYYSYLWAEVLSADVFSLFEEQGIFNCYIAQQLLDTILSCGGSQEAMHLFIKFRGREPSDKAFLRYRGIQTKAEKE